MISFLSIFVPNVSAKSVYMKRSRFERLGVEVSSESFSIIDDPTIDEGLGSYSFDGEGNPGMRKFIIKDGVLTSFLSDQKYGSLLGIGSTGNAIRSYSSQPIIDSSNLLIPSGNETLDEGIFIRSVYGEHTANPITGDFSLNIELGYIVNNRGVKPFKGNMIVGNIFEMLKNVTSIDKNVEILDDFIAPKITTWGRIV